MNSVHLTHDTSHYDKCRTIMNNQKKNHMARFFILFITLMFNGYFHIIPMPVQHAVLLPETMFARNAIFTNGFGFAVLAFLVTIALIALGLLATPEKPLLVRISLGVVALALLLDLINPFCCLICLILFIIALHESKKAAWVKEQPGYPYFNERFYEQMETYTQAYKPEHDIESVKAADMQSLEKSTDRDPFASEREGSNKDYIGSMPDLYDSPAAIPSVPKPAAPAPKESIAEIADAIPEPAPIEELLPIKQEIPAPTTDPGTFPGPAPFRTAFDTPSADFPETSWDIPDPVMNTKDITSDFPDIAGDIQDLPDIPDIPKL